MTDKLEKNSKQELSLENLNEVSGGRIKLAGYALLSAFILQMKELGKDKDYCIESLKSGWETNCNFKVCFTDETGDDLQKAIDFINATW